MIFAILKTLLFALVAATLHVVADHALDHVAANGVVVLQGLSASAQAGVAGVVGALGYVLHSPFRRK